MNYTQIVDTALSYSDREDLEVTSRIDLFMRIVESRMSNELEVGGQALRALINTVTDQVYYGLPADFSALRDIQVQALDGTEKETLSYLTPEQMNTVDSGSKLAGPYYTLVAGQLQIFPTQKDKALEVIYYARIPELTSTATTNWVSELNPQSYIFGLLVEINAFVKDAGATSIWEQRFMAELKSIKQHDSRSRWSGTPLTVSRS